jgi:uncharacterized integral membrane protein (TIGR00698 family)
LIERLYKGVLLAVFIGLFSYFAAPSIPYINGVLLSFVLGVLLGNLVSLPKVFSAGIKFSSSKILEIAIVLLAFGISFGKIAAIGSSKFILIAVMIVVLLVVTILLAKRIKGTDAAQWMVGFGTAICGSSAIAALAPTVTKNSEETGIAIAIVNLLGSVGMIFIPIVLTYLNMSEVDASVFIGAGLHSVGNVAGAGFMMTDSIGEQALTIKMARVALLSPAIILFNIMAQTGGKKKSVWSHFKLPPYLWAFIAITILVSVLPIPQQFLDVMKKLGDILLIIAMAAIGLKISILQLAKDGRRSIVFGLVIFGVQLALIGLLLSVL